MPADNKQSRTGCSASAKRGCGCIVLIVCGIASMIVLGSPNLPAAPYLLCTLVGLILYLAGVWEDMAKKRHEREYVELLAEFKQDGMNEVVYDKIILRLNHGVKHAQLNVATALPEEISRYNEVLSIRCYTVVL